MTAFLWTMVVLMAASLLAEVAAFIGMALLAKRASRRASELAEQIAEKVQPSIRQVNEIRQALQPRVQSIRENGREMGLMLSSRLRNIQAVCSDASRRAERMRLRLNDSVLSVEQHRREVQREVVEPIESAGQVLRGLKLALWFLRKVA